MLFKDPRCSGSHDPAAARTILLGQLIVDSLTTQRLQLQHGSIPAAPILQNLATIRTVLLAANHDDLIGFVLRDRASTVPTMTGTRATQRAGGVVRDRIGFDRQLG